MHLTNSEGSVVLAAHEQLIGVSCSHVLDNSSCSLLVLFKRVINKQIRRGQKKRDIMSHLTKHKKSLIISRIHSVQCLSVRCILCTNLLCWITTINTYRIKVVSHLCALVTVNQIYRRRKSFIYIAAFPKLKVALHSIYKIHNIHTTQMKKIKINK